MCDLVTGENNKNNSNYNMTIDNTELFFINKLFVFVLFINFVFCLSCSKTMRQGQSVIAQIISPVPKNMVLIPGGTFIMGSHTDEPKRNNEREGPQHQVTISSFYIAKYPVTQSEFQAVNGVNPSHFKGDNLPVENINLYEAIEYCNLLSQKEGLTPAYTIDKSTSDPDNRIADDSIKWLVTWNRNTNGYRLPTEAEWEYACRAGTITTFYTGNNITTDEANYNG